MGYHIIDQLIWWFGYPDQIDAQIDILPSANHAHDTEDSAKIDFSYKKLSLRGTITLSRSMGVKDEHYSLKGAKATINGSRESLRILRDTPDDVVLSLGHGGKEQMMDNQLDYFIKSIETGNGFKNNHRDNLLNMKFIEECYRAHLTKEQSLYINNYIHTRQQPERLFRSSL